MKGDIYCQKKEAILWMDRLLFLSERFLKRAIKRGNKPSSIALLHVESGSRKVEPLAR